MATTTSAPLGSRGGHLVFCLVLVGQALLLSSQVTTEAGHSALRALLINADRWCQAGARIPPAPRHGAPPFWHLAFDICHSAGWPGPPASIRASAPPRAFPSHNPPIASHPATLPRARPMTPCEHPPNPPQPTPSLRPPSLRPPSLRPSVPSCHRSYNKGAQLA